MPHSKMCQLHHHKNPQGITWEPTVWVDSARRVQGTLEITGFLGSTWNSRESVDLKGNFQNRGTRKVMPLEREEIGQTATANGTTATSWIQTWPTTCSVDIPSSLHNTNDDVESAEERVPGCNRISRNFRIAICWSAFDTHGPPAFLDFEEAQTVKMAVDTSESWYIACYSAKGAIDCTYHGGSVVSISTSPRRLLGCS